MKSPAADSSSELNKASQWTRNYRNQNPNAPKGHCIKKEQLEAILSQPGCEGIRAYYGLDDDGNRKLVLVGIDANENDILSETGVDTLLRAADTDGAGTESSAATTIATDLPPCPPCCSIENPLNS
ncbi:hypothetical protein HMJ29_12255 [Hymenobacter taeanensis]|uniref:Uncharacterized protein n=1 Tax=Hymenobacter taeanensis TaxID=2735321 RepID=A0A6M6BI63_9BACT|nr:MULTISPECIES: hypothetical protein [Hymenobacter]QJX47672.1 hypothetical protein HMJ29_12255 [Hymenobacter taeanensis]UOQ82845.1 hypothetical protein MUN83_08820 [Hymenobacter sp. 5414T-23]